MRVEEVDSGVYGEMLCNDIERLNDTTIKTNDPQLMTAFQVITNSTLRNLKLSDKDLRGFTDSRKKAAFIVRRVVDAYNATKKNTNLQPCFNIVNSAAGAIGENIGTAFSTLSGEVAKEADKVEKKIDSKTEQTVQDQNSTEEADDKKNPNKKELKIKRVKWDALLNRFGGTEIIKSNLKDYTKITPTLNVDEAIAIGDSVNNTEEDINLDKETVNDVQNRVAENISVPADKEEELKEATADMYKVITSNYHMHNFMYNLYLKDLKNRRYGKAIVSFCRGVRTYLPILQAYQKTELNVSDHDFDKLHKNMDTVLMNFEIGAYAMASLRKRLYENNTILMDEGVVNPDVEEKEADEGKPITEAAMSVYYDGFCNGSNDNIPTLGIKASDIRLYKDKAADIIRAKQLEMKANMARYQGRARQLATEQTLHAYLESIDDSFIPKGLTRSDFVRGHDNSSVQKVLHSMQASSDQNLQGLLYDFIIDVKYPNSKLKNINRMFSETAADVMREHEADGVDEKDLKMVDSTVAAKMAVQAINDIIF